MTTVDDQVTVAVEANSIVNVSPYASHFIIAHTKQAVIRESWRHRKEFESLYDVSLDRGTPSYWTADLIIFDALSDLFSFSISVAHEYRVAHGDFNRSDTNPFDELSPPQLLLNQLGDLARFIFSCGSQRQQWLSV